MAVLRSIPDKKASPIRDLSDQEMALRAQIEELEDFVVHGPERERKAEVERMNTIPPPAEIEDRKREREFLKKHSRREIMNEKRSQASNGLLLILLLLAILAMGAWIYCIV